jgi:hypothetical protein
MAVSHDMAWTYRAALESPEPVSALRHAVAEALDEYGGDRARVRRDLEQLRVVAQSAGEDESAILDTLDFLVGWSSPQERI